MPLAAEAGAALKATARETHRVAVPRESGAQNRDRHLQVEGQIAPRREQGAQKSEREYSGWNTHFFKAFFLFRFLRFYCYKRFFKQVIVNH